MTLWCLSEAARADIVHIYADGIERFGEAQALRYRADLETSFDTLADAPGIGREHVGTNRPVHVHFHAVHVITYLVEPDGIMIVRVLPGRSAWKEHI